jgi:hypothetical protein
MTEQTQSSDVTQAKPSRTAKRSPYLFPAYDFGFARQIAERVERDGAGTLSEETLAIALNLSVKSSGFQLKTLTARQFGLLEKQGNILTTTDLAKAIFKPTSEAEKANALAQSFMKIPLFREVANRFKGRPLPPSQDFRNFIERELGIDSKRVADAERVLKDSARETGVIVTSGSNSYLSTESAAVKESPKPAGHTGEEDSSGSKKPNGSTNEYQNAPIININIDSEDFASMEPEKIEAFFAGLSRIIRKEENQKE